jgi:cation diffusion facilitator family transporter
MAMNLAVAAAKIAFGAATGAVSILSDGFHSLTDSASNVVALTGARAARKPPDDDHPYGHRKFETLASAAIVVFLLLVMMQVLRSAWMQLQAGGTASVTPLSFGVMLATLSVNFLVVWYERGEAARLQSEVLLADAMHTQSDILTSLAVIVALVGVWLGYPLLDPIGGLFVAAFIGKAGFEVAREASGILSDKVVMAEDDVRRSVMAVPGVVGCHHIRTRGTADYVFLDLHVWLDADTPLREAHRLSHVVKDRLMAQFPQMADVIIHIEPPPQSWRKNTSADYAD